MYVKISEIKARLSFYLAKVKKGQVVIIQDRDTPIARVVPFHQVGFEINEPSLGKDCLKVAGVLPRKPIDVQDMLRQDRDAR